MSGIGTFDLLFFGLTTLLVLLGGIGTVAAKNPIRGAMGLLTAIVGIAGMYLQLAAEFLAAIQIIVYAGAVVVLFLFVIMLLGPQATTSAGAAGTKVSRYFGAGVLLVTSVGAMSLLWRTRTEIAALPKLPPGHGTIEGIGRELFTTHIVPFELSGALLLVAVVGAVAVARGKQIDPTSAVKVAVAKKPTKQASGEAEAHTAHAKEAG
ncbi:MAG: NADH-quinone oxidoreductase subunit J [Polyangiaceae bacterium]|nr:NADH-quinone oxidoreductase subunit J [Polyangiaceae bacterium]